MMELFYLTIKLELAVRSAHILSLLTYLVRQVISQHFHLTNENMSVKAVNKSTL